MTIPQGFQPGEASARREVRAHKRRKPGPMAYVELGQDNGGILLNLGEGGFAVRSALAFQATEFPELRFQVPQLRGWRSAGGRIVWMSENKTVAGIQFLELPEASRLEIRKWASAEEEGERAEAEQRGTIEPRTMVSETAYPGDPRDRRAAAPMQAAANTTRTAALRESVAAARMPPAAVPVVQRAAARAGAAQAPPSQDFRFNEYSMFAAEPGSEQVWVEAGRQKTGSGRVALLLIVVAALFFALGATVGRGTLDPWIAYVEAWVQGPAAPSVKSPAAVDHASSAPDSLETKQQEGSGATENQAGAAQQAPIETAGSNPPQGNAAPTESGRVDGKAGEQPNPEAHSQANPIGKGPAVGAGLPGKQAFSTTEVAPTPAPKQPAKAVAPRSASTAGESEDTRVSGHAILVNAPEPGSPPFGVNLPSETVSASSNVAISVQRSIQVPPRTGTGYARPERVLIGRLISHGEPFYPPEARNRRLEGAVQVHATIGRTGHVIGVRAVSGPSLLASAAMTAIREWRYEPTFIDGDPVETQAEIAMVFRLP